MDAGVLVGIIIAILALAVALAVLIYYLKCRNNPSTETKTEDGHVIGNLAVLDSEDRKQVNGLQNSQKQPNDGEMIIMNPAALEMQFDDGYKKHSTGLAYQVGGNRDLVTDEPTVFVNTAMQYDEDEYDSSSLRRAAPYQETDNTAVISNIALSDVTVKRTVPKETSF